MDNDLLELENAALDAARAAAQLILEGSTRIKQISTKAHDELFTEYDVRSEELVRRELSLRCPGIPVVGEEQGGEAGDDLTWYIDPIDGTINYIAGHPFYAVSVGLAKRDAPLAGAVVAPALGIEWSGRVGGGTRKNGKTCRISTVNQLRDSVITTGFPPRSGASQAHSDLRALQCGRVACAVRDLRRCGSAAIDLCLVADGTYELYWMRKLSPWDVTAGASMVLASGGRWSEFESGSSSAYNLASNGAVEDEFLELLGRPDSNP